MSDGITVEDAEDNGPFFKYRVPVKAMVTGHIRVAARSEEEAEEKAFEEFAPELCIQCSGGGKYHQHSLEMDQLEQDGDVEQVGDAKDEDDWEDDSEE